MKSTIILIGIVFLGMLGNAQNNLVVFSDDGEKFIMHVNGVAQNQAPETNVKAVKVSGESVRVKLAFNNKSIPELTQSVYFESPNKEYTYVVKKNKKGNYVLRYMSESAIQETVTETIDHTETVYEIPQEHSTQPQTQESTTVVTTETVTTSTGEAVPAGDVSFTMSVDENGMNVSVNDDEMGEAVSFDISVEGSVMDTETGVTSTTTTTTTTTYSDNTSIQTVETEEYESSTTVSEPLSDGRCAYPVSDSDFESIRASLESKTFEDSKFTLAKQITKSKCLEARQIGEIMKMFDFEDTRLDFAKFAWEYVYDKDNYYLVNDAFEFELTIDELNEFLELK